MASLADCSLAFLMGNYILAKLFLEEDNISCKICNCYLKLIFGLLAFMK